MMVELHTDKFLDVLPLLNQSEFTPTTSYAVIHHVVPGNVYVDQVQNPMSAFIRTASGIYHLVGNEKNESFNRFVQKFFWQNVKGKSQRFTLFSSSKLWDQVIEDIWGEELRRITRLSFELNPEKFVAPSNHIPEEFSLRRVDKQTIQLSQEFKPSYYEEYWGSVSNYLKNGFGYCLLDNNQIVSECTAIFMGGGYAEMDIVTHSPYRGRGLASIVARAFISHCLEKGWIPRWECNDTNTGSKQMAEKLGFKYKGPYSLYIAKREDHK